MSTGLKTDKADGLDYPVKQTAYNAPVAAGPSRTLGLPHVEPLEPQPIPIGTQRLAWSLAEVSLSTGLSLGFLRKQVKAGALNWLGRETPRA